MSFHILMLAATFVVSVTLANTNGSKIKGSSTAQISKKKMVRGTATTGVGDIGSSDGTEVLLCSGTEPFWSMEIKGKKIVYKDAVETSTEVLNISEKVVPMSYSEDYAFFLRGASDKKTSFYISIRSAPDCTDGMSDAKYTHEIMYLKGNVALGGCCNRK